jgi:hypothetical protein
MTRQSAEPNGWQAGRSQFFLFAGRFIQAHRRVLGWGR